MKSTYDLWGSKLILVILSSKFKFEKYRKVDTNEIFHFGNCLLTDFFGESLRKY